MIGRQRISWERRSRSIEYKLVSTNELSIRVEFDMRADSHPSLSVVKHTSTEPTRFGGIWSERLMCHTIKVTSIFPLFASIGTNDAILASTHEAVVR